MNKPSLLNSLRFRLVTTSGKVATICAAIAVAMIADWTFGVQQFVYYYLTFGETDVPPEYFFILFPLLLASFLFTAGIVLSAVILRLRIRRWARQLTMFAEYQPMFMPAYAGLLFDYSSDHKEVYATLLDLHFRGAIRISSINDDFDFTVVDDFQGDLNDTERLLVEAALQYGGDPALCKTILEQEFAAAQNADQILDFELDYKIVKRTDAILFVAMCLGGIYAIRSIVAYSFFLNEVLSLLQPRYPATIFHLIVLGVLSLITIAVILTGFLPRFDSNHKSTHVSAWMHVAGWRYYLQTVYKDRMSPAHIFSQDPKEIRSVLPYLIVFGIVDTDRLDIPRLLTYVDN